ncbi:hypothetical protein T03_505 [Trichinella britovi]|uniref:Uncharacterized protein n=1 Tax=Trichinella britovi TaxID=45882 RepID=A0A0V0YRW0_TRIBR|nr:hypothetical protein T03_505 [Trichinella britovi]
MLPYYGHHSCKMFISDMDNVIGKRLPIRAEDLCWER